MKPLLPALLLGLGLSSATITPAAAYPVDCAILLCLAGGWPASAECAHARAVFIHRITPWPIEPPLQIWNCPMRVSFEIGQRQADRLSDTTFPADALSRTAESVIPKEFHLVLDQADVDISGAEFDFVRSIQVFEITYQQRRNRDGMCDKSGSIYVGSYGAQGGYTRQRSSSSTVPEASSLNIPPMCNSYRHRSVFVEWRDYEGVYGHEEVHY